MQASEERAVKVLNGLIETTMGTVEGYREAARHTHNPQFKTLFKERCESRRELSRRLQDEVRSFGVRPEAEPSVIFKLQNTLAVLKEMMSGGSDKAVIDEVERGEDLIKARFQQAAADADLPPRIREMVVALAAEVKAEHDEISRIKHSMH